MRGQVIDCQTQNALDNESFNAPPPPPAAAAAAVAFMCSRSSFITVSDLLTRLLGLFGEGKEKKIYTHGTLNVFCSALKEQRENY